MSVGCRFCQSSCSNFPLSYHKRRDFMMALTHMAIVLCSDFSNVLPLLPSDFFILAQFNTCFIGF